jgi:hypothetical protein
MRRIARATRLVVAASAVILFWWPLKAGAAGIYENAAAEPAFLLSPRRITLSADLDFARKDPTEAAIYRIGATFPLRTVFAIGLEQNFVSVSDDDDIESGVGDLTIRADARVWGRNQRSIVLLGYLAGGTTKQEFFPYSTKTLDVSTSLAYVDTLGNATAYAIAGKTFVNRKEGERPVDVRHDDNWRFSAGAAIGGGDVRVQTGTIYTYTVDRAERWMWYGAVSVIASDELVVRAGIQFETGEETQRVSDWSANAGLTVRF